jgi:hypothetical protein
MSQATNQNVEIRVEPRDDGNVYFKLVAAEKLIASGIFSPSQVEEIVQVCAPLTQRSIVQARRLRSSKVKPKSRLFRSVLGPSGGSASLTREGSLLRSGM